MITMFNCYDNSWYHNPPCNTMKIIINNNNNNNNNGIIIGLIIIIIIVTIFIVSSIAVWELLSRCCWGIIGNSQPL